MSLPAQAERPGTEAAPAPDPAAAAAPPPHRAIRALEELGVFCLLLLLLDVAAKVLLAGFYAGITPALGVDWQWMTGLQAGGLGLLALAFAFAVRPSRTQLAMPVLFLCLTAITTLLLSRYQDFSYDGQWYHFHRVAMFPIDGAPANAAARIGHGPAVFYADLPDNLRGLSLVLLRTGPFSAIGVNFGLLAAIVWFWQRHGWFLPRALRWMPAAGPVVAAQLLSYYSDGWVSLLGSALFLVALLIAGQWSRWPGQPAVTPMASARFFAAMAAIALVFAQLKFSFPFALAIAGVPLVVGAVPAMVRMAQVRRHAGRAARLPARRRAAMALVATLAGAALALANPYGLIVKSALVAVDYQDFSPQTLEHWRRLAFDWQLSALFGETSRLAYFAWTNLLAIWPAETPALVDPGVHGAKDLAVRLLIRAGAVGARWSGFGPLAVFVLGLALIRCGTIIARAGRGLLTTSLDTQRLLAIAFALQIALSIAYPLGWWARMNPAVYVTATCLALIPLAGVPVRQWTARPAIASALCLPVLLAAIILPLAVQGSRSGYKMGQIRGQSAGLARRVAALPSRTLELPPTCPGAEDFQLSFATKFVAAFPEQRLTARFRNDASCRISRFSILPDDVMCICQPGPDR